MSECTPDTCNCKQPPLVDTIDNLFQSISVKGDNEWTRAKHGNQYTQEEIKFGDTL